MIRFKHIGPLTPEVLADKIVPLLKKLRCDEALLVALLGAACWRAARRRAKEAAPAAADPALEARMMRIAAELRCLVCQNQTIADSNAAPRRRPARARCASMLQQGKSDAEIVDYMTDALRRLRALPAAAASDDRCCSGSARRLMLAGGAAVLVVVLRRRSRMAADAFEPTTSWRRADAVDAAASTPARRSA